MKIKEPPRENGGCPAPEKLPGTGRKRSWVHKGWEEETRSLVRVPKSSKTIRHYQVLRNSFEIICLTKQRGLVRVDPQIHRGSNMKITSRFETFSGWSKSDNKFKRLIIVVKHKFWGSVSWN
jgi:hypothetical protein